MSREYTKRIPLLVVGGGIGGPAAALAVAGAGRAVHVIEKSPEFGEIGEPRARAASDKDTVRLFIGAGRRGGIRPGDLVGAIAGETGVPASAIGAIEIADSYSLVSVPEEFAEQVIAGMKKATLRGQKVTIRRERERPR